MNASGIGDYALIGDGRSAALVSRSGSIDWLCWPRFDSPALFAALLDPRRGGAWRIAPSVPARISRRYQDDTNVLETRFDAGTGELVVTDLMPVDAESALKDFPRPENEIVRRASCRRGEVDVEILFDPRPDYGLRAALLTDAGPLGYRFEWGRLLVTLRGGVPLAPAPEGGLRGTARLRAGESLDFSLTATSEAPAVLPPLGDFTRDVIERTLSLWRRWAGRAVYDGPFRSAVVRSALALKLLAFAPSGAIVAAPTTSLPEKPGGPMNWDYRFCWLRDASLTVRSLHGLGYPEEARAFVSWLLHATRLTLPEFKVLYDVYGRNPEPERTLPHLDGYRGSRPVRVGNAAADQLQLDVYGEVVDAVARVIEREGPPDRETQEVLRELALHICSRWREPDSGIWEFRSTPRHYTYSRALCWTALDRLIRLHRQGLLPRLPADLCRWNRMLLWNEIHRRGYNPAIRSYTQTLDGSTLDASLLLLSWYGFEPASSSRMRHTFHRIRERLLAGPGLLFRYEESRRSGEGAFVICSFWAAEFLARGGGTAGEAKALVARVLSCANDLGLLAEEAAPGTREPLGNFPQAFSHVGLISAALGLAERESRERTGGPAEAAEAERKAV